VRKILTYLADAPNCPTFSPAKMELEFPTPMENPWILELNILRISVLKYWWYMNYIL